MGGKISWIFLVFFLLKSGLEDGGEMYFLRLLGKSMVFLL